MGHGRWGKYILIAVCPFQISKYVNYSVTAKRGKCVSYSKTDGVIYLTKLGVKLLPVLLFTTGE